MHFLFLHIFKLYSKFKSNFEFSKTLNVTFSEIEFKFQNLLRI